MNELDDIWEFLPETDETGPRVQRSAEEAALHIAVPTDWGRPFDDAARLDVATAEEDAIVATFADDEDDGLLHPDTDHEFDVAELLERQHYSFAPDTEEPP